MSRNFTNNSYYFITVPTSRHIPFFNSPEKKLLILERINKVRDKFQLTNFDFGIISNHYHIVTYFKKARIIPQLLQFVNGGSAYSLNKITGNKQTVWDEYHIYLIEDEELITKVRGYVIGNPLKHNEVKNFEELKNYPFSSYNSIVKNIGEETANEYIKSVIELDENKFITIIKNNPAKVR